MLRNIVVFAIGTGLRLGEISAFAGSDIELSTGRVNVVQTLQVDDNFDIS